MSDNDLQSIVLAPGRVQLYRKVANGSHGIIVSLAPLINDAYVNNLNRAIQCFLPKLWGLRDHPHPTNQLESQHHLEDGTRTSYTFGRGGRGGMGTY